MLRRLGQTTPHAKVLHAAGATLDRDQHFVTVDNQTIDLTPSELDLLSVLMASTGWTFSRYDLLDKSFTHPKNCKMLDKFLGIL